MHSPTIGRALRRTVLAVATTAALAAGSAGVASAASGSAAQVSAPAVGGTRFYVPPPSSGEPQQALALLKSGDFKDALKLTEMEAFPRAVWFTSGTPAQVE